MIKENEQVKKHQSSSAVKYRIQLNKNWLSRVKFNQNTKRIHFMFISIAMKLTDSFEFRARECAWSDSTLKLIQSYGTSSSRSQRNSIIYSTSSKFDCLPTSWHYRSDEEILLVLCARIKNFLLNFRSSFSSCSVVFSLTFLPSSFRIIFLLLSNERNVSSQII